MSCENIVYSVPLNIFEIKLFIMANLQRVRNTCMYTNDKKQLIINL